MAAHDARNLIGHLRRGDTLRSAWNSDALKGLRLRMLAGQASATCEKCYEVERVGQPSWRTSQLTEMAHHRAAVSSTAPDGEVPGLRVPYFDVRFSNVCNLRCRICAPKLSSSWHADGLAVGTATPGEAAIVTPTAHPDVLWQQVVELVDDVERIHFAGGEPLLQEEHFQLLDLLIARQKRDVLLSYNTNFSRLQFKHFDIVDMWRQFANVRVQASLDGAGSRGDYMRKGQDWRQIVANRERLMRECPHVNFSVLATVSIMNVLHVPDFYREWVEQSYIPPGEMRLNILFEPAFLNVRGLTRQFKQQVTQKYVDFIERYLVPLGEPAAPARLQFEAVLQYMAGEDLDVATDFRQYTMELDLLRRESFIDVFPELEDFCRPAPYLDGVHRGRAHRKFRQLESAVAGFTRAIVAQHDDGTGASTEPATGLPMTLVERGQVHADLGNDQAAEGDFSAAIALAPAFVAAYVERGFLRHRRGDRAGAAKDYATAAAPFDFDVATGTWLTAVTFAPIIPDPAERFIDVATSLAEAAGLRRRGRSQAALAECVRVVCARPVQAIEFLTMKILASRGEPIELMASPPPAPDVFSTLAFGYFLLGAAKTAANDPAGAAAALDKAHGLAPDWRFIAESRDRSTAVARPSR